MLIICKRAIRPIVRILLNTLIPDQNGAESNGNEVHTHLKLQNRSPTIERSLVQSSEPTKSLSTRNKRGEKLNIDLGVVNFNKELKEDDAERVGGLVGILWHINPCGLFKTNLSLSLFLNIYIYIYIYI